MLMATAKVCAWLLTSGNDYKMNGIGYYEYGVEWGGGTGGSNATPSPLTFQIAAAGLSEGSVQFNALGYYFAADIISGTTGNTGIVGSVGAIPEPETYAMLLAGLGLLGFMARRRTRNIA